MAKADFYPLISEVEQAMVRQVLADPALLPRMAPYVQPARFRSEPARLIVEESLAYLKEYHQVPTLLEVLQGIRRRVESGAIKAEKVAEAAAYYEGSHSRPPVATKFVLDVVADEERKTATWQALDDGLRNLRDGNLDQILTDVQRASLIGRADVSLGTDVYAALAKRTDDRRAGRVTPRWGTGIRALDNLLGGGLAAGELGCFLGSAKSGKSTALHHVALHTASIGGCAVVITLEMSELAIAERQDAAISGIPIRDLGANAEEVDGKVREWFADRGGQIFVKYMPPRLTTVRQIRAYLDNLRAEKGVVPTQLIIDYADLMGAATGEYDKKHEEQGLIYTELRALAGDLGIPAWTASQANREALSQKVVKAENIGESLNKIKIVDALVAICRTDDERLNKNLRLFLALCRFAQDGIITKPLESGYEMGRFVMTGEEVEDGF